jgi:hypothetical protein
MSSDDEFSGLDQRRASVASPVPPASAGGTVPEDSPKFDNNNLKPPDDTDRRASVNGHVHTTAIDIANTDERVREVLYSDVQRPFHAILII